MNSKGVHRRSYLFLQCVTHYCIFADLDCTTGGSLDKTDTIQISHCGLGEREDGELALVIVLGSPFIHHHMSTGADDAWLQMEAGHSQCALPTPRGFFLAQVKNTGDHWVIFTLLYGLRTVLRRFILRGGRGGDEIKEEKPPMPTRTVSMHLHMLRAESRGLVCLTDTRKAGCLWKELMISLGVKYTVMGSPVSETASMQCLASERSGS